MPRRALIAVLVSTRDGVGGVAVAGVTAVAGETAVAGVTAVVALLVEISETGVNTFGESGSWVLQSCRKVVETSGLEIKMGGRLSSIALEWSVV